MAKSARRERLPAHERRAQLLDLAAEIIVEGGLEALTMEAIRERGQISRGLAYAYFANAEQLALALYEREMQELERRLDQAAVDGSLVDRLRAATHTYFEYIADRDAVLPILQLKMTSRWNEPSVRQRVLRLIAHWAGAIVAELDLPFDVASSIAAAGLSATEAFATTWRHGHLSREAAETLALDFVLGGIQKASETARQR